MKIEDLPELATRQDLAALTGISVPTFARWATAGRGEGPRVTKLGHASRYRKADVVEWLDGSRQAASA
ncbi:helix-turn-helix transcriptional regulator [Agrococcus jejuensis]|uniref:Helix-turn-helix domain-containing protein n=1 Tax=Agrococcus jejuensis TaxID=399736 RepID=A0A1G8EZR0_9MICO|nr:helix-turn-helix domain-containing protein [Agrococcus jejuensis]SDH75362.1 Helix-turn-helix domain-containing protein [Agrococcus jejuensis]